MKFKLYTTTLFVILFNCLGFGQNDWISGHIIKINNDTIKGFIQKRDSKYNAKQCNFRLNMDGEIQEFNPMDILGYRIDDSEFFISKNIEGLKGENLKFLEFLINGKVNIYHLKENESRFFVEKEGKIYELQNTNKNIKDGEFVYQKENKEYIGILSYLLNDADMLFEIYESKLNSKSLVQIAKKYHEKVCTSEQCIIYERNKKPVQINFGIHTGISLNKFNFGSTTTSDYRMSIMLGCRFEFENTFEWAEKTNLIIDINYQKYSNYQLRESEISFGSNITYDNRDYYITNNKSIYSGIQNLDVNINTHALKIPIIVNYNFSTEKLKPYIGIGVSTKYIISQNKGFIFQRFCNKINKSIPIFHYGFIGNIGNKYLLKDDRWLYFEFVYEYTTTTDVNKILRFNDNTFSLSFGYIF